MRLCTCQPLFSDEKEFLPKRLISVGDPKRIVLRQSSEIEGYPRYATLSHCWGLAKFLTLTRSNFESWQVGIPLGDLSKTFCDAIATTRRLGLEYIWIDSLCIIQDDDNDWKSESVRMSEVYGRSALNIAATASPNGHGGLFYPRDALHCELLLPTLGRVKCAPRGLYLQIFRDMPLLQRGWTLQERLLPCRTVHFTNTEILWECHCTIACETYPHMYPLELRRDDAFFHKKRFGMSLWHWAVGEYTSTQLTFPRIN